ncbi:unnamed protein product [Lathyrus oleraceus]
MHERFQVEQERMIEEEREKLSEEVLEKCIYDVIERLKSMGVLIHPNSYQLDIHEKVVENIVIDGASMKGSCSDPQYNIDTTLPQSDNTQRLSRMIEEISDIY